MLIAALLMIAGQSPADAPGIGRDIHREHLGGGTMANRGSQAIATKLSRAERKAIAKVRSALGARDYVAAAAALEAAKQAAKYREGRLVVSVLQLQLGQAIGNAGMQVEAIDLALATGLVPKAAKQDLDAMRTRLAAVPAAPN